MSSSFLNGAAPDGHSPSVKKKRVLLVDTSRARRDMRAETMRRMGMDVDCAADICEARSWWRPDLYDLVLFHVQNELPQMYRFWDDIRAGIPSQRTAFLVGKPEYLSALPSGEVRSDEEVVSAAALDSAPAAKLNLSEAPNNWGILEACRRISAVRSVADARVRALRNKPLPPRESGDSERRRTAAELEFDRVFSREEMQ